MSLNSKEVRRLLLRIEFTSSRTEKEALLAAHANDETLRKVLVYAYSPFVQFYVGPEKLAQMNRLERRQVFSDIDLPFSDSTWELIECIAHRGYSQDELMHQIQIRRDAFDDDSFSLLLLILSKDLRAGFSGSTIEKVLPGLIPTFPYMRCTLPESSTMDQWEYEKEVILAQEKADGAFLNVNHGLDGHVCFFTRQGSPIPAESFPKIAGFVSEHIRTGTQMHGEIVIYRNGVLLDRKTGNGIVNSVIKGGTIPADCEPVYLAWDQIPLDVVKSKGRYSVPYTSRLGGLILQLAAPARDTPGKVTPVTLIETRRVKSKAEAMEFYREKLSQGKEGAVLKRGTAIWRDGTSQEQVKLKLAFEVELEVLGFNEGTGKYKGSLGSMICQTSDGKLLVNVNGRSDAMRKEVWANQSDWTGAIVTVKSNGVIASKRSETDPHSLFLPVFVERRFDKSVADDLQQVRAQEAAAMK